MDWYDVINVCVSLDQFLHEIGHVGGHLLDFGVVERLNVVQRALVVLRDEVDGHTLATESTTATNSARMEKKNRVSKAEWLRINQIKTLTDGCSSPGSRADRS